jgi:hypothetical protein
MFLSGNLKIPYGKWEDNIRIDFRETGCEGEDWIHEYQHWD